MSELLNRIAPDFSLPVLGGGRFTLSSCHNQIVVINFWSAECPWSRRADVVLAYRLLSWERQGVRVVGIVSNATELESDIRYEAEVRQVRYPLLLDLDQKVADRYKAEVTPQLFVTDRQGYIRYTGAVDDATVQNRVPQVLHLDNAVSVLLKGILPDPARTDPYGCAIVRRSSTAA